MDYDEIAHVPVVRGSRGFDTLGHVPGGIRPSMKDRLRSQHHQRDNLVSALKEHLQLEYSLRKDRETELEELQRSMRTSASSTSGTPPLTTPTSGAHGARASSAPPPPRRLPGPQDSRDSDSGIANMFMGVTSGGPMGRGPGSYSSLVAPEDIVERRSSSEIGSRGFADGWPSLGSLPGTSALQRAPSPSSGFAPRRDMSLPRDLLAPRGHDRLLRELRATVDEGEARRQLLMSKLKDAQQIIAVQSDKLTQLETNLKSTSLQLDELKYTKREYSRRINELEGERTETQQLKVDTLRLRETLQDRIETVQLELKHLQAQHRVLQNDYRKRSEALEEATRGTLKLQEENARLTKEMRAGAREVTDLRDQLERSSRRRQQIEEQATSQRSQLDRLKEESQSSTVRITSLTNQVADLSKANTELKQEMETLLESLRQGSEEKQKLLSQLKKLQEDQTDLRGRVASATSDRERLQQECEEMTRQLELAGQDSERLRRAVKETGETSEGLQDQLHRVKVEQREAQEREEAVRGELTATKKVSEHLSSELRTARGSLEAAEERVAMLEQAKQLHLQQRQVAEDEKRNLERELDILRGRLDALTSEGSKERLTLEDTITKFKGEMGSLKEQRTELERKCRTLEERLSRAQKELSEQSQLQQDELETWRNTAERLTASLSKKEEELGSLHSRIREMESEYTKMRAEYQHYAEQYTEMTDMRDDLERLQLENRRLTQDKAENEQVITLLETQKRMFQSGEMLSLMSDGTAASDSRVQEMATENEGLREKVQDLEGLRDDLIKQKEELLSQRSEYYEQPLPDPNVDILQEKCADLEHELRQLKSNKNDDNDKLERLERDNVDLRHQTRNMGSMVPKDHFQRLEEENQKLQKELEGCRTSISQLENRQQAVTSAAKEREEVSFETSASLRRLQREKESLENQISLVRGQVVIVENAKKRAEDQTHKLEREIDRLRDSLRQKDSTLTKTEATLRDDLARLRAQLKETRDVSTKHERLVSSLKQELLDERSKKSKQLQSAGATKQESLADVSEDLTSLREELHKLKSVIQSKDETIERLERELTQSHAQAADREAELEDLQSQIVTLDVGEGDTIELGNGQQVIVVTGDGSQGELVMGDEGEDYYWIHEEEDEPPGPGHHKYTRTSKQAQAKQDINPYASYTDLNKLGLDPRATLTPIQSVENSVCSDEEAATPREDKRENGKAEKDCEDGKKSGREAERKADDGDDLSDGEKTPTPGSPRGERLTSDASDVAAKKTGSQEPRKTNGHADSADETKFDALQDQLVKEVRETESIAKASALDASSDGGDTLTEMQALMRRYLDEKTESLASSFNSFADSVPQPRSGVARGGSLSGQSGSDLATMDSGLSAMRWSNHPSKPVENGLRSVSERAKRFESPSKPLDLPPLKGIGRSLAANKKVSFSSDTKGGDKPQSGTSPRTPGSRSSKDSPSKKSSSPLASLSLSKEQSVNISGPKIVKPVAKPMPKPVLSRGDAKSSAAKTPPLKPSALEGGKSKEPRVSTTRSAELRMNALRGKGSADLAAKSSAVQSLPSSNSLEDDLTSPRLSSSPKTTAPTDDNVPKQKKTLYKSFSSPLSSPRSSPRYSSSSESPRTGTSRNGSDAEKSRGRDRKKARTFETKRASTLLEPTQSSLRHSTTPERTPLPCCSPRQRSKSPSSRTSPRRRSQSPCSREAVVKKYEDESGSGFASGVLGTVKEVALDSARKFNQSQQNNNVYASDVSVIAGKVGPEGDLQSILKVTPTRSNRLTWSSPQPLSVESTDNGKDRARSASPKLEAYKPKRSLPERPSEPNKGKQEKPIASKGQETKKGGGTAKPETPLRFLESHYSSSGSKHSPLSSSLRATLTPSPSRVMRNDLSLLRSFTPSPRLGHRSTGSRNFATEVACLRAQGTILSSDSGIEQLGPPNASDLSPSTSASSVSLPSWALEKQQVPL